MELTAHELAMVILSVGEKYGDTDEGVELQMKFAEEARELVASGV